MIIVERKRRRQSEGAPPTPQCSAPGCNRSARFDFILLGTEHSVLCNQCRLAWEEAWQHALHGWPDDIPEAA